jgi:hypothetical protein
MSRSLSSLVLAAFVLLACVARPDPRIARAGAYEQQVEEGFGRLDQVPRNWSMLPR